MVSRSTTSRVAIRIWGPQATGNAVLGNFVGTDAAGTFGATARVTGAFGVQIQAGSSANRVGRPGNADRNVISGLADRGVALFDSGTDDNIIQNNVVGLTPDGSAPLPNWGHGIDINHNASDNLVGGDGPAQANVVAASALSGIEVSHNQGSGDVTQGNQIIGNLVGTNLFGTAGPAGFENGQFGVHLEGHPRCTDTCGPDIRDNLVRGNVIVGSRAGVMITKGAHGNLVTGNWIGVLRDGSVPESASNALWGVLIQAGAFDNDIVGNVVAGTPEGVQIRTNDDYADRCYDTDAVCPVDGRYPTFGNTISRNSIYGIGGLGIDLWPVGAVTAEPDPSVQGGIRIPDIIEHRADTVVVSACGGCTVELFRTDDPAGQQYGPGRVFIASMTADSQGTARFTGSALGGLAAGSFVSATATDPAGNTSEFARRRTVAGGAATTTPPTTAPSTTGHRPTIPPTIPPAIPPTSAPAVVAPPAVTVAPGSNSSLASGSGGASTSGLATARRCGIGQC